MYTGNSQNEDSLKAKSTNLRPRTDNFQPEKALESKKNTAPRTVHGISLHVTQSTVPQRDYSLLPISVCIEVAVIESEQAELDATSALGVVGPPQRHSRDLIHLA